MPFDRVAILGTGLIGASAGLAIKAARPSARITGYDSAGDHARGAQKVKAVDRLAPPVEAVKDADLVLLAMPVRAMREAMAEIAPHLPQGAVVMDLGSTKAQVLAWAEELLPPHVAFVGGHPMAGKTVTGPEAAEATLFNGAVWCLAPSPCAPESVVRELVALVESFGARPYFVDADEHDGLVASISHLPYLMAVALVDHLARESSWREAATLAAGGFAYASHLSDSDPRMFADIAATNRESLTRRLDRYIAELQSLRDAIASGDADLQARFERARGHHQDWLAGKVQRQIDQTGELPSARSMLAGSLFGGLAPRRPGGPANGTNEKQG